MILIDQKNRGRGVPPVPIVGIGATATQFAPEKSCVSSVGMALDGRAARPHTGCPLTTYAFGFSQDAHVSFPATRTGDSETNISRHAL
jgi:hypothetical protein